MAYVFTSNGRYPFWPGRLYLGRDHDGQHVGIALERHALTIAGSRGGKGVGLIVQNARKWTESLLCLDPKEGENLKLSWQAREALGQKVYAIDPFNLATGIPDRLRATFNPLDTIDITSLTASSELENIADGLVVSHDPKHMEWTERARRMLAGLAAWVLLDADAPKEVKTLATVRRLIMQSPEDLHRDAQIMQGVHGLDGLAVAGGRLLQAAIEAEKGIAKDALELAQNATAWLDKEAIAQCLASSSFSLSELKERPTSVFVVLHPDLLEKSSALLRLFVQASLNAMTKGGADGTHCLFIMDEFYSLGRMDRIQKAMGKQAAYGVHLWPILQNLGQLDEDHMYKVAGRETFLANSDAVTFFNNGGDERSLDYIARRIGPMTPEEITSGPPAPEPFDPIPQPRPQPYSPDAQPKPAPYVGMPQPQARAPGASSAPTQKTGWFSSELTPEDRLRDENAMRAHRDGVAGEDARNRASNDNAMRQWQTQNAAAQATHRAKEDGRMREWATQDAAARERHKAAEDARMREWSVLNERERLKHEAIEAEKRARHDFAMRSAFQPRLTPYEAERLIAKREGEKVARSMIVFALGGDILNVPLYPYYVEQAAEAEAAAAEAKTIKPMEFWPGATKDYFLDWSLLFYRSDQRDYPLRTMDIQSDWAKFLKAVRDVNNTHLGERQKLSGPEYEEFNVELKRRLLVILKWLDHLDAWYAFRLEAGLPDAWFLSETGDNDVFVLATEGRGFTTHAPLSLRTFSETGMPAYDPTKPHNPLASYGGRNPSSSAIDAKLDVPHVIHVGTGNT